MAKKRRFTKNNKRRRSVNFLQKLKGFVKKNAVALFSTVVSVLVTFIVYYLAYSEPDIRADRSKLFSSYITEPMRKDDGKCFYKASIRQTFKNLSIKNGHVSNVNIISWSERMAPEFNLIEVDKDNLGWRQETEVQVIFGITLDTNACNLMNEEKEKLDVEVRFYDNIGKLLNKAIDGEPIYFYLEQLPKETTTQ